MTRRFTMEKKLVVQVRYYEKMFVIRDSQGDRIFTGTDEKRATEILRMLNAYYQRKHRKTRKSVKAKTLRKRKSLK